MSAGILVKLLGFFYQLMIVPLAGTENIGLFNMVYPLYSLTLVVTTAGVPTAVARLIPAQPDHGKALVRMSATILIITSSLICVLLLLFGPALLRMLHKDVRVIPAFIFMAPNLLLISVSSVIRAYFQGHYDMRPTAAAQTLEQIVRIVSGLLLIRILAPHGDIWTLLGMASSMLLSEMAGFLYLWRRFNWQGHISGLIARPTKTMLKNIYAFGVPLTLTRIILTLTGVFEASLIPARLYRSGMTLPQSAAFYGELTGVVFMLLNVPSIFTFSLATSLMPSISQAQNSGGRALLISHIQKALSISVIICVPIAMMLFFYGAYATERLFGIQRASLMLKLLSGASLFFWLSQVTSGILQGLGLVVQNGVAALIGSGIRLAGIWYLGADPSFMIQGICLSFNLGFVITCLLNLLLIRVRAGACVRPSFLLRCLAAAAPSLIFLTLFQRHFPASMFGAAIAALGTCALFFGGLFLLREPWIREGFALIKQRLP
jgi:stage V sporulation protein B